MKGIKKTEKKIKELTNLLKQINKFSKELVILTATLLAIKKILNLF